MNFVSSLKKFRLVKQRKVQVTQKELESATFHEMLSQFILLLAITVAFLDAWFK